MKRFFCFCLCLISMFALNIFMQANFFVVKADDVFAYDVIDSESVGLKGVKDTSITNLVVPSTVDGLKVVSILKNSSSDRDFRGFLHTDYITKLEGLDLSNADNLTTISASAFASCSNLKGDIYLPASITTIGRMAFSGTSISRVFVNSEEIITLGSSAFPSDTLVVYSSQALMTKYFTDENTDADWANYDSAFKYSIVLNIDGESRPIDINHISGCEFGETYNLIMKYLAGYNILSIEQSGEVLSANTIADGTEIIVKTQPVETKPTEIPTDVSIKYGETLEIFTATTENATYKWKFEGNYIDNTTNELKYDNLIAGEYIAICETYVGGAITKIETFNIVVNKLDYIAKYPSQNRFVCFDFSITTFTDNFNTEEVEYKFYFNNKQTEVFSSLGEYKVEVSLTKELSTNYQIVNPTFTFYLTPAEISISWPNQTYSYTGQEIRLGYAISGNKWGYDLKLITTTDSTLSATNVGEYHITVSGTNSEYFILADDAITTFNWEIEQTVLTVKWETVSYGYTSLAITPIAYGESGNIRIKLNIEEQLTGNTEFINVDTYNIVATIPSEFNGFVLQGQTTNSLTINPKRLDAVFISNNEFTYNGAPIEVFAEITTEVEEEVNLILSGNKYKDAGDYTAQIEGVDNPNFYVDENITFNWSINPKLIIVNWIPNVSPLKYMYNGSVQKPRATVETGIDGETIELIIECDNNKLANEDASSGYLAVAKLPDDIKNYTLSNASIRYFITRAYPQISVAGECSVPYNGENQLPAYDFVGDVDSLKITLNGIQITNGVKEPGTYEIFFSSKKSQNYYASEEIVCMFTIKGISVSGTSSDGSVVVQMTDENGLEIMELPVDIINDFDTTLLQSVDNVDDYYFYRAMTIGSTNDGFFDKTLSFNLNSDKKDVRIFLITSDGLKEMETTIIDGVVSISGGQGDYVILIERQNWWSTAWGITTISLIIFAVVIAGLVVAIISQPKKAQIDKQVNEQLERLIKYKANNGETFTSEDIKRLRKEIKADIKNNKKDN